MKRIVPLMLSSGMILCSVVAQTPQNPPQEVPPEDVVRITTELVQTDIVVTDKNERVVSDLKLDDFELYDNGHKQDLRFSEFVSTESSPPDKALNGIARTAAGVDTSVPRDLAARDVKRVIAFVVEYVRIPPEDMPRVRGRLSDFGR